MIRTPTGAIEVKSIGEESSGAKIVAIRPLQIDIEIGGVRKTLTKQRQEEGG